MRAHWTRRLALRGESALKEEALQGRSWPGAEPGKEGGGVSARPLAPGGLSLRVRGVKVGAGGHTAGSPRLGRRGETWPEESDSGTFRNSRRPGAFGRPSTPARPQVPGERGSSLGGAAGPLRGRSETGVLESQARGRLSASPPPQPQGPPLFLIKFKLGLLRALPTRCPLPSPPPSFYSAPPRLFTLPLSLSHHLVYTHPLHPSFPQAGA